MFDPEIVLQTFYLRDLTKRAPRRLVAIGCLLPQGEVALAWVSGEQTHGCYSSLDAFEQTQKKIPGRDIEWVEMTPNRFQPICFQLKRTRDPVGVDGSGVTAVGAVLSPTDTVLQWLGDTPSTFWYRNLDQVERLHEHQGLTAVQTS